MLSLFLPLLVALNPVVEMPHDTAGLSINFAIREQDEPNRRLNLWVYRFNGNSGCLFDVYAPNIETLRVDYHAWIETMLRPSLKKRNQEHLIFPKQEELVWQLFLREFVLTKPEQEKFRALVEQLDHIDYKEREKAQKALSVPTFRLAVLTYSFPSLSTEQATALKTIVEPYCLSEEQVEHLRFDIEYLNDAYKVCTDRKLRQCIRERLEELNKKAE